jgi:hypothetical protein
MARVRILTLGILVSGVLAQAAGADPVMQPPADAFINLGAGPYPEESAITTGNAQPWYDSSQVVKLFGDQPSAQQQADFDNAVMQRVEQTFRLSGVSVNLTDDPSVAAAHTLSVVSNTSSRTLSSAIGMTYVGGSGFNFIDQIAPLAQSVDQLEWIVAHNVSHELMLAFGVGENYDHTGNFIDAPVANWLMMTDPKATFSSAAAGALLAKGLGSQVAAESLSSPMAQLYSPEPVPEPASLALWALAATVVAIHRRRMQ